MEGACEVSSAPEYIGGIDVGGTSIKVGVIRRHDGAVIRDWSEPTHAEEGPTAVVARIRRCIRDVWETEQRIASIGVGMPGVVHPVDRTVHYPPNFPEWGVVPLQQLLQASSPVPVTVENDANAAAIAEARVGAGAGVSHFLYVTLGTGVGGGIVIDGKVYAGPHGDAGEIGHVIVDMHERPTEEQREHGRTFRAGTMEELIGRIGLLRRMEHVLLRTPSDRLRSGEFDVADITTAAAAGDAAALEVLTWAGQILGVGLASALNVLGMHVVIVGGGISQAHPRLLDTAIATIRERAIPTVARSIDLRVASLGAHAGVVGAAMIGALD
jgi:glucokinase